MKASKMWMSWPGRAPVAARATCVIALTLTASRADAATGMFSSSGLPMLLLMLPLLAALAYAVRSWMPGLQGRRDDAMHGSGHAADWARLASQARQFFRAHGLVGLKPEQDWSPAQDLLLRRDQHGCLVRARLWRARQVDAAAVQQMARDIARVGASRGILLCERNVFTPAAQQLARQQRIMLLDPLHMPIQATPRAAAPARASMLAGLEPEPTLQMPLRETDPTPGLAPTLLRRPQRTVRSQREFLPTEPVLDQPECAAAAAADNLQSKAPLLGDWKPASARPEFLPTEPLLNESKDGAFKAQGETQPGALLLGDWKPAAPRPEFLPTEPLLDQSQDGEAERGDASLLTSSRPVVQPPEPLLAEFQASSWGPVQASPSATVPSSLLRRASLPVERPVSSLREFLPTMPAAL